MFNINYTNVNFINQANFVCQNNFQLCYQNSFYKRPNNFYKKQNIKNSNIKPGKKFSNNKKSNYKEEKEGGEEKEENKYFKLQIEEEKILFPQIEHPGLIVALIILFYLKMKKKQKKKKEKEK